MLLQQCFTFCKSIDILIVSSGSWDILITNKIDSKHKWIKLENISLNFFVLMLGISLSYSATANTQRLAERWSALFLLRLLSSWCHECKMISSWRYLSKNYLLRVSLKFGHLSMRNFANSTNNHTQAQVKHNYCFVFHGQ